MLSVFLTKMELIYFSCPHETRTNIDVSQVFLDMGLVTRVDLVKT